MNGTVVHWFCLENQLIYPIMVFSPKKCLCPHCTNVAEQLPFHSITVFRCRFSTVHVWLNPVSCSLCNFLSCSQLFSLIRVKHWWSTATVFSLPGPITHTHKHFGPKLPVHHAVTGEVILDPRWARCADQDSYSLPKVVGMTTHDHGKFWNLSLLAECCCVGLVLALPTAVSLQIY